MAVDDGQDTETFFGENKQPPSRIGLRYSAPVGAGGTIDFVAETGFGLNGLNDMSPMNDAIEMDFDRRALRKLEVILDTARFGRFSIGQGSMASDGAAGVDLSGTTQANGVAVADIGGGIAFRRADGTPSGTVLGDVFNDLDGPRRLRVRYDTPEHAGFSASVAYGQEVLRDGNDFDYSDAALRYANDIGATMLEAALSYEWVDSVEEHLVASGSILHAPTGLNLTLAGGAQQVGEGGYVYIKLGLIRDIFPVGATAFSVDYYRGEDFAFAGADADALGAALSQRIDRLDLDLFITHRRYSLASHTEAFSDVEITMFGARWNI